MGHINKYGKRVGRWEHWAILEGNWREQGPPLPLWETLNPLLVRTVHWFSRQNNAVVPATLGSEWKIKTKRRSMNITIRVILWVCFRPEKEEWLDSIDLFSSSFERWYVIFIFSVFQTDYETRVHETPHWGIVESPFWDTLIIMLWKRLWIFKFR